MKVNKRFSHRLLSCFVILSVLASAVLISTSVFAQSSDMYSSGATAGISYSFTGDDAGKAGFAEGTITVKANDSNGVGSYYLYWANDSKALEGYYPIDKLSVTTSGVSTKMYMQTAIPADATKIIAFKASSEPTDKSVAKADAVYTIPQSKRFPHSSSEKHYSFGSYSDIHIANDGYGSGKYPYDEVHWRKALDSAAARNLDFIVTGGDNVNNQNGDSENNYISEWKSYQKVLADSDYCNPIYESIGNHEMWTSKSTAISAFVKATGLLCDEESLKSDKAYYTFDEPKTGDHFIIMSLETNFNPKYYDEFSTTQLNWVKNLLNKYKNDGHNIYIYEHAGFWQWGVGDDEDDPYYDIPLGLDYSGNKQLQQILYDNPNVMFFCGHTHIYFSAQFNYMDYDTSAGKATAKMIHNSSVGGIRKPLSTTPHLGNMDRTNNEDETEGYFVDSYGDYIICNGANLYYNLVDPKTTYIVEGLGSADPPTPTTTSSTTATTTSTTTTTTTTTSTTQAQEYSISYNIDSS
ncbi:MAG: metallophosphoesterase family protein, partial [Ruminococcus sp.]